jgi:hypothetical protein
MQHRIVIFPLGIPVLFSALFLGATLPRLSYGQATFTAQVRGTVQDATGAMVPGASVTITADATQVTETVKTDQQGRYLFPSLQPTSYTIKVEAQGFKTAIRPGVVLRVSQQVDVDFALTVGEISSSVEISATAPLLNSVTAALGTEVTNRYIVDMPLLDRSIVNLAYLAPGVTEVPGSGIDTWGGTNFVSNGQRNATADVRLDGALSSSPEGGEGANSTVKYQPTVEFVQEFKLQNNSFSAEYGNNGGTVINIVTKSGGNEFHGSGYWFFRRPRFDANDFFSNRDGLGKADYARDQYGASLGGPIRKQKTFFFVDFEVTRNNSPATIVATVPTALQKAGDFSQTFNDDGSLQTIFNPFSTHTDAEGNVLREPFPNNRIPSELFDPIGANIAKLYPEPNQDGDPITGRHNWSGKFVNQNPSHQFDIKIDEYLNDKMRLSGRYSNFHSEFTGGATAFLDGITDTNNTQNVVLDYSWMPTPVDLVSLRLGVDRYHDLGSMQQYDPANVGFGPFLSSVNGFYRFPIIEADGYQWLAEECCADTMEAHTQWNYSGSFSKFFRGHNLKFGGEQRIPIMAYYQPDQPTGYFTFSREVTMQDVFNPNDAQGNSVASMLLGWPVSGDQGAQPATIDKSKDTGFFIQDDWKVNQKLTLNMGLRYEWSTPFVERFNRLQWPDFSGDTGVDVPGLGRLKGTTVFATNEQRSVYPDRNNLGPRLGLAYRLNDKTVLRAGAGMYFGLNPATNYQYVGSAFYKRYDETFSKDDNITRYATLSNLFPDGVTGPEGTQHGKLARWGYSNSSTIDEGFRNAEIYQWNFGVQRELAGGILIDINYSASRSNHLAWGWGGAVRSQNFVSKADREKWGKQGLSELVPNPFQPFFVGPDAVYDAPDSIYSDSEIPRRNLLRPYPQFNGTFAGMARPIANARYNALQIRFEKRYSYGLNFTGNYTFSKMKDDTSFGSNAWLLNDDEAGIGNLQDPTNHAPEYGVGFSDTPHRFVVALSYELPFGRGKHFGTNMARALDYVVGGWKANSFVTFQSGNPVGVRMDFNRLQDGAQRPNVSGDPRGASIQDVVDGNGNYFNDAAFSDPGDQVPGNAPRYFDNARTQGIRNLDFSVFKSIKFREKMQLEIHAEFFNFTNTPRFGRPGYFYGADDFGLISSMANSPRRGQIGFRFTY